MSDPHHSDASDRPLPAPLPGAGWVVGAGAGAPPTPTAPAARQTARLEARLAVYAQHAAAVAEQAAATLAGDLVRAESLAREREAAAEHYGELQALQAGAGDAELPSFGSLLTDALAELEHQAAVDLALRQRLVALRDAVSRGAAWAAGVSAPALPAASPSEGVEVEPEPVDPAPVLAMEGGWLVARADGVTRALAGRYPGVAAPAGDRPGRDGGPDAGAAGAGHVDLRF